MNPLRRFRQGPSPADVEQLHLAEANQPEELMHIQFVESHRGDLAISSDHWNEVATLVTELKADGAKQLVREGIDAFAESIDLNMPESAARAISAQSVEDLAMVSFLAARSITKEGNAHSGAHMLATITKGLPVDLHRIAAKKDGLGMTYNVAAIDMRLNMKEADRLAGLILKDFTKRFSANPDSIIELSELYNDGIHKVDPGFFELREIIRTDWYAKDPSTSVFHCMMESLNSDPDLFLDQFIDKIISTEGDKRIKAIQEMARFALRDSETTQSDPNMRDVLLRNRKYWQEFDDIDSLFSIFKTQKLAIIQASFDKISGLRTKNNPRLTVSPEELAYFKKRVQFDVRGNLQNRETRRKSKPSNDLANAPAVRPDISQVQSHSGEFDRSDKTIYFTKSTGSSSLRKEALDDEKTIKAFVGTKVAKHLVDDLVACIKKINENPFSPANKKMIQATANIEGKKLSLRRFKSNDSQGLNISKEAASYRVCFAIIDGSIVITDILNHDAFTAKFG